MARMPSRVWVQVMTIISCLITCGAALALDGTDNALGARSVADGRIELTRAHDPGRRSSWYAAAKTQWVGDALVASGAGQNTALDLAAADLRRGEALAAGDRSAYRAAIAAIANFEQVPLVSVTAAQLVRAKRDVHAVDRFFGLPHNPWNVDCIPAGVAARRAAREWAMEPAGTNNGVKVAPLTPIFA
jgi:hypothetical protein